VYPVLNAAMSRANVQAIASFGNDAVKRLKRRLFRDNFRSVNPAWQEIPISGQ